MWKKVGACCLVLLIPTFWGACAGKTFVDAREKLPCDITEDCPSGDYEDNTVCISGWCECPNPDEERCCEPGAPPNECERKCRPVSECNKELCTTAEDCTGPVDSRCGSVQCVQGVCRSKFINLLPNQLEGDCKDVICDATGRVGLKENTKDVFNDFNECTFDTCMSSEPMHIPLPAGKSPESELYCDGTGQRVACITDEDCLDPVIYCSPRGECVPSWCINGGKDTVGGETAIDCGGPCDPCPVGIACESNSDCIEHVCEPNKKCAAPTCYDGIKNGSETDIDCGAPSCPPCEARKICHAHDDCDSGVCKNGRCQQASCSDGAQNRFETDIDCGGGECPPCPLYINAGADERH